MNKYIKIALLLLYITVLSSCQKGTNPTLYIEGGGVVDADGNSYETVIIGDQEWMAENLKSNLFCSGDSIPYKGDTTQLRVYNDDPQNEAIYGKLYNYQAVLDTLGLCPCGWHVPKELEYAKLINYLGGYQSAMKKMMIQLVVLLAWTGVALADGYTIQTPGQMPSYVTPNYGGGYTIQTPGQMPSYVSPNYGGGATIQTPGQMPSYVTPNYGGGSTIQTQGQMPTYVTPNYGGGATIQTPGQMPSYVTPNYGGGYTIQTPGQMPTYINPR